MCHGSYRSEWRYLLINIENFDSLYAKKILFYGLFTEQKNFLEAISYFKWLIIQFSHRHIFYFDNFGKSVKMKEEVEIVMKYEFTQPLFHGQDVTQGWFLSTTELVWIQSIPYLRLVAVLKLRNPGFPAV